ILILFLILRCPVASAAVSTVIDCRLACNGPADHGGASWVDKACDALGHRAYKKCARERFPYADWQIPECDLDRWRVRQRCRGRLLRKCRRHGVDMVCPIAPPTTTSTVFVTTTTTTTTIRGTVVTSSTVPVTTI